MLNYDIIVSSLEVLEHHLVTKNSTVSSRVAVSPSYNYYIMCVSYGVVKIIIILSSDTCYSIRVLHNPLQYVTTLVKVSLTTILPHLVAYGFVKALNGPPTCKIVVTMHHCYCISFSHSIPITQINSINWIN